ncbi:hypothetical protein EV385_5869 [Krasilnikovia cinnamomea]|uniref:Uncharacterized protein n=1 Tax=Krasilnikovia cinnamomea TaxID=349313 RepID=A0A4Q7ZTL5_9ACTN|nr:hypothetical protein EV385_5869 [Krasilnikovia cinnamomea]
MAERRSAAAMMTIATLDDQLASFGEAVAG